MQIHRKIILVDLEVLSSPLKFHMPLQGTNPLITSSSPLESTATNTLLVHLANSSESNIGGTYSTQSPLQCHLPLHWCKITFRSVKGQTLQYIHRRITRVDLVLLRSLLHSHPRLFHHRIVAPQMPETSNTASDRNSMPAPLPVEISNSFHSTPLFNYTYQYIIIQSNHHLLKPLNCIFSLESLFTRQQEQKTECHIQFKEILAAHRQLLDNFRTNHLQLNKFLAPDMWVCTWVSFVFTYMHRVSHTFVPLLLDEYMCNSRFLDIINYYINFRELEGFLFP